jgi:CubicO group peptidase (beta-lactamase class C family)
MTTAHPHLKQEIKAFPIAEPETVGMSAKAIASLCQTLRTEVDRRRLPGAVAMIIRDGQLVLHATVGQRDPVSNETMMPDALFRIYSMTKPIVSVAVMMLMEQGKLQLSDSIAKYLPEFASPHIFLPDSDSLLPCDAPTIHDLLRHTAGLSYEFMGTGTVHAQYAAKRLTSRKRSNAQFSQELAALPLLLEPGTMWEYSRATDVLGRLVEVISGQSLGCFLRQQIFDPLGMHDTGFAVTETAHHRLAEAFAQDPDGGLQIPLIDVRTQPAFESGGGGLVSCALDYARFLQCLLNGGALDGQRLLARQTVALMTTDHLGGIPVNAGMSRSLLPEGTGFGLGFAVQTVAGLAGIRGAVGTYAWEGMGGTSFFVDPTKKLLAILMLQAPNQRDEYRILFRNLVYAAVLD